MATAYRVSAEDDGISASSMTVKILHVFDHSLPLHSGYVFRSLAILRAQAKRNWTTVHVTTPKHTVAQAEIENFGGFVFHRTRQPDGPLTRIPIANEIQQMRLTERVIETVIRAEKPDIVHAHSPVLNAFPALRAAARCGLPVVYEVRALWEDAAVTAGATKEGSLRYRVSRALESYALRRVDAVTTICEGLRREIIARGIPSSKVTVIPNAVDIEAFTADMPRDDALAAELGLANKTVLGFIGSFYSYEGLDLVIRALPKVAERLPDLVLLLVGGGPVEDQLRSLAAALGVGEHVVFTGRVPQAEVGRYYGLIDLLVYARHRTRLTDMVTPLKPLEAMAQKRLFLASDVGGHKELIRDGETGFLFRADDLDDLANRIIEVLSARARWPEILRAGRRFVEEERNWDVSVARYQDVYDRLLGRA